MKQNIIEFRANVGSAITHKKGETNQLKISEINHFVGSV